MKQERKTYTRTHTTRHKEIYKDNNQGSQVRNIEWCFGLVIHTGNYTKLARNTKGYIFFDF